jgi:hypothetical protein
MGKETNGVASGGLRTRWLIQDHSKDKERYAGK